MLISRLTGIAEEMGAVLRRAASSPNIKERADCSAALFTADGELLVQAEHIPVHLGSMPASVRAAIDAFGDRIEPGDQVVLNDPYAGGTHLNDVTLVAPCFAGGELVGWAANRAHHADLGGMAPGSMPPEAVDIQQEGLRIPPVLLTRDVAEVVVASSRTPDERRGDLDAQRGANRLGVARLAELADQLASTAPLAEVVDYGERRMRAALAALPDGQFRFEDVLDSAGPRPEQQSPTPVVVTLTVDGERATFDFTGTGAQRPGNVNAVEAVTVSAVAFALRSATDPTIPANGGAMRPGRGDRAGRHGRRGASARRGRRRQRRGEPAGRRRVPRRPRARRPRPPRRGGAGDDEQRARRGRRVGVLRDRRRRAGRPSRARRG